MVFLVIVLPILLVSAAIIGASLTKKKSSEPQEDPNAGLKRMGLTLSTRGFDGSIGECVVSITQRDVETENGTMHVHHVRVTHAGVDKALSARNEANHRVRAGAIKGGDMGMGAHDFDRLIDVSAGGDPWCFVSRRARENFVALAALHTFRLSGGELSVEKYMPGNELQDCVKRMTSVMNTIAAGDPARALVDNVEETTDRVFMARCVRLLRQQHAASLLDVRDRVAQYTGFGLNTPPRDEHLPRILLFHPDATVVRAAIDELGRIGTPLTLKFLAEHKIDPGAAKDAITERFPELAAGSGNLSLASDEAAGGLSVAQIEARKQKT